MHSLKLISNVQLLPMKTSQSSYSLGIYFFLFSSTSLLWNQILGDMVVIFLECVGGL